MINHYDIAYSIGLGLSAPVWLSNPKARRKVIGALRQRMGHVEPRTARERAVMIHAVSVGELNATPALVNLLRRSEPTLHFVISTTTETGFAQAQKLYGQCPDVSVIRYPLDFSIGVTRVLDRLRPSLVVLMELEVWPNFLRHCQRRNIPVIVANGRMSAQSFRNYRFAKPVIASMFRRLTRICAQDQEYANRFIELGAKSENVVVTGTMKFDTAQVSDHIAGDDEIAQSVGLNPDSGAILVAGSTGPGEEETLLRLYRDLLSRFNRLRLVLVPRKPERFDEVANLITALRFRCVRRSAPDLSGEGILPAVVLGDTMGELRKFYSLATLCFVGRSLVDLGSKQHGSDMIEAAALAKPVLVGPWTGNFADAMRKLRQAEGVLVVENESELRDKITMLLENTELAAAMGRRAQEVVLREQGSTQRHADVILDLLRKSAAFTPQSAPIP